MSPPHYVLAGGGTGGHLYPGLAVADALRRVEPNARITFFTTRRPLDRDLLARTGYEQMLQPVQPFTVKPWRWPAFWRAWRRSVCAARRFLEQHRPRAVLGLGGYAAGPPIVAARGLGIRTAILNPDVVPGRANRYLAPRVDLVVLQWDASRHYFPAHARCRTLGCPIRADFAHAHRAEGQRRFELDPARPTLLVTGASQGARTINQALQSIWPRFLGAHPNWQLVHLTGPADEATSRAAYVAAGSPARVLAFTHEMPLALAAADLVVSRSGASTLAELTALGKPSILLPYPFHRDRHQHANARMLVDAGAAILVEDSAAPTADEPALAAALERLADAEVRDRMAQAAARLGRPHAAADVAAWLAS